MASKEKAGAIVAASLLATAGLLHLTRQAKLKAENLREATALELKKQINYEWLVEENHLTRFRMTFPRTRSWQNVDYLIERVIADPSDEWNVTRYHEPPTLPQGVCQVEERRTIVPGIYLQKLYKESKITSKFGNIFAKTELFVVGESRLFGAPKYHPDTSNSGFSYHNY